MLYQLSYSRVRRSLPGGRGAAQGSRAARPVGAIV